jgi:predicted DNA-binding transcriptional regulator AlpA
MADRRLVRVGKAVELTGVSDQTIYRWAARRLIDEFRDPVTGSRWFVRASIEALIARNTVTAKPQPKDVGEGSAPRKRKARSAAAGAGVKRSAAKDAPWKGSVFGDRPGGTGGSTAKGAASSAATRKRGSRTGS